MLAAVSGLLAGVGAAGAQTAAGVVIAVTPSSLTEGGTAVFTVAWSDPAGPSADVQLRVCLWGGTAIQFGYSGGWDFKAYKQSTTDSTDKVLTTQRCDNRTTITAGSANALHQFNIETRDDDVHDGDRTVIGSVEVLSGGHAVRVGRAPLTIVENDPQITTIGVSTPEVLLREGQDSDLAGGEGVLILGTVPGGLSNGASVRISAPGLELSTGGLLSLIGYVATVNLNYDLFTPDISEHLRTVLFRVPDDELRKGDRVVDLRITVNGMPNTRVAPVRLRILDDEVGHPEFTGSVSGCTGPNQFNAPCLRVPEGGSATYSVKLTAPPAAGVTQTVTPSFDTSAIYELLYTPEWQRAQVTFDPPMLSWTAADWQTTKSFTVRAAHDDDMFWETFVVKHTFGGTWRSTLVNDAPERLGIVGHVADDDTFANTQVIFEDADGNPLGADNPLLLGTRRWQPGDSDVFYTVRLSHRPSSSVGLKVSTITEKWNKGAQPFAMWDAPFPADSLFRRNYNAESHRSRTYSFNGSNWNTPRRVYVRMYRDTDNTDGRLLHYLDKRHLTELPVEHLTTLNTQPADDEQQQQQPQQDAQQQQQPGGGTQQQQDAQQQDVPQQQPQDVGTQQQQPQQDAQQQQQPGGGTQQQQQDAQQQDAQQQDAQQQQQDAQQQDAQQQDAQQQDAQQQDAQQQDGQQQDVPQQQPQDVGTQQQQPQQDAQQQQQPGGGTQQAPQGAQQQGGTQQVPQGTQQQGGTQPQAPAPDPQLITDVRSYVAETHLGAEHVTRWKRALEALGANDYPGIEPITVAEARSYVDMGWPRWFPVLVELMRLQEAG
ncbi:hypothetical protein [Candidatus Poriferisodalis sp.]|uniref:hypothetical protein n=1 Tax=Candidatus Poriferisodalis sp. TaxID=3101277 RepID=UPI003B01A833